MPPQPEGDAKAGDFLQVAGSQPEQGASTSSYFDNVGALDVSAVSGDVFASSDGTAAATLPQGESHHFGILTLVWTTSYDLLLTTTIEW